MNLSLQNISKSFSNKIVLQNLSMKFEEGKIHAILGENGAGKSTIANIICGELQSDGGKIIINNEVVSFKNPKDSLKHKICYVHQRPIVAESLSVYENLRIGLSKQNEKQIHIYLNKWISDINPKKLVKDLGADIKFFIALISVLLQKPQLLILDEPTALLDDAQQLFLFKNLKEMAENGTNIIIITHNLLEAQNYCDNIFYLQDGCLTDYSITNNTQINSINKSINLKANKTIEFKNISCKPSNQPGLKNVSFTCQAGKITRIHGLSEDGLQTLENIITGFFTEKCSGKIQITTENNTQIINLKKGLTSFQLRKLVELKIGIVPTDRKFRGSNPELTINEIVNWNNSNNENFTNEIIQIAKINIKPNNKAKSLSGGMLQRLIIAREFHNKPDFLILCHPMQGLDPETCLHITKLIQNEAINGTAILVLTAGDFNRELCDYNYELNGGKIL